MTRTGAQFRIQFWFSPAEYDLLERVHEAVGAVPRKTVWVRALEALEREVKAKGGLVR